MNINATLIGQSVAFFIFVMFCMKYVWPPVITAMRENGVLMGANGMDYNVLKIRPPLAFGLAEADQTLEVLDHVLAAL